MTMLPRCAAVLGALMLVATTPVHGDAAPAHAATATKRKKSASEGRAPPPALSVWKRAALLKKQIDDPQVQSLLDDVPLTLDTRLTPLHPVAANGARIEHAYGIWFVGPRPENEEGLYNLFGENLSITGGVATASSIDLQLPTEPGKIYIVDCRVLETYYMWKEQPYRDATVFIYGLGNITEATSVDGHVLVAFTATATETKPSLVYKDPMAVNGRHLAFWGCDVGKVN